MYIRTLQNIVIMGCLASSLSLFLILGALTSLTFYSEHVEVLTKIATYIIVRMS